MRRLLALPRRHGLGLGARGALWALPGLGALHLAAQRTASLSLGLLRFLEVFLGVFCGLLRFFPEGLWYHDHVGQRKISLFADFED